MIEENGWNEWRKYILKTLEKLEDRISQVEKEETETRIEIEKYKMQSKIYGSIAGLVTSAILTFIVGVALYIVSSSTDLPPKDINTSKNDKVHIENSERS